MNIEKLKNSPLPNTPFISPPPPPQKNTKTPLYICPFSIQTSSLKINILAQPYKILFYFPILIVAKYVRLYKTCMFIWYFPT